MQLVVCSYDILCFLRLVLKTLIDLVLSLKYSGSVSNALEALE